MKSASVFLPALLALITFAEAQTHPRLFFNASDIPGYRAKANTAPWSDMLATAELAATISDDSFGWFPRPQYHAVLHLFKGDTDPTHAAKARDITLELISNSMWQTSGNALDRGTMAGQVAVAYDICYSAWAGQSVPATVINPVSGATINVAPKWIGLQVNSAVSQALRENGDNLMASGGTGWPGDEKTGNNWHGIRYAGAGLCYLATDQAVDAAKFSTAVSRLTTYFRSSLGAGNDSKGWNAEGINYLAFPGQTTMPFVIALKRNANAALGASFLGKEMRDDIPGLKHTLQTLYPGGLPITYRHPYFNEANRPGQNLTFTGRGLRPDFTDDHPLLQPEGTAGLGFALAPPEYQAGMKWMFRRFWGGLGDHTWDSTSGQPLWSLLYYPAALAEQNPANVWGLTWKDPSMGMFVMRDRYQDENDTLFQATANLRPPNGGHGGPDDLSFRLWSLGVPWVVGSGRNYTNTVAGQTTISPSNPDGIGTQVSVINNRVHDQFQRANGDGFVVLKSDRIKTGATNLTRRYVVDHDKTGTGASATVICSDTCDVGTEGIPVWRLNTPSFNTITYDDAARTFTITSPDGKTMRGKVLWPDAANFTGFLTNSFEYDRTDVRFPYKDINHNGDLNDWNYSYSTGNNYVDFEMPDGTAIIVLTVVDSGSSQPNVTSSGSGNNQTVTVGTRTFTLAGDSISATGWTRPNVAIASPVENQNFTAAPLDIPLSGTASGTIAINRVEIYLDDIKLGNATLVGNNWSYTLPSVTAGARKISALAIDTSGNQQESVVNVNVFVSIPPVVTLDRPASSQGSAQVSLPSGGGMLLETTVTDPDSTPVLTWSRMAGPAAVTFGSPNAADTTATFAADGSYLLRLTVSDGINNVTRDVSVKVGGTTSGSGGGLTREVWNNIPGHLLTSLTSFPNYPNSPSSSAPLTGEFFEAPTNAADDYGQRIRGLLIVPQSGNYVFTIASDDYSELWLSTDSTPANKVRVASVSGFTNSREWTKYPSQQSDPIPLVVGQSYYIEALHKDGQFGDNLAVGFTVQGAEGIDARPIPMTYFSAFVENLGPVVDAGTSCTNVLGVPLVLDGSAADDGQPVSPGAIITAWSKVSGPGTVTFGNVSAVDTTATFGATGNYTLRLAADDGGLRTFDDFDVTVVAGSQVATSIKVDPANASVLTSNSQSFAAKLLDQYGQPMASQPTFVWSVPPAAGSINAAGLFTAAANAGGPHTVTASATGKSGTSSVVVSTSENTRPTLSNLGDQITPVGVASPPRAFTIGDLETDPASLSVSSISSNPSLVPDANITLGGSGAGRMLSISPTAGLTGSSIITVTVSDGVLTASESFLYSVNPRVASFITVSPPAVSLPSATTQTFGASVLDQAGEALAVQPAVTWSVTGGGTINSAGVFTAGNVLVGSHFVVASLPGAAHGLASVTVTNTAPGISNITDKTTAQNTPTAAIAFTVSDLQTSPGNLTVSAFSSNPTLVSTSNIVFGGSGANRTLTITPTTGRAGSATITVTVSDGAMEISDTFLLTVTYTPVPVALVVSPAITATSPLGTRPFSAVLLDQADVPMNPQPTINWSVSGGGGIDSSGTFTAGASLGGPFTVTATASSSGISGTAELTIRNTGSLAWIGGAGTSWGTASNWSGGSAPISGDFLIFSQGNPASSPSNNYLTGVAPRSLTFLDGSFLAPLDLAGNGLVLAAPATTAGASISRPSGNALASATLANHGFVSGQSVVVSGAIPADLNGVFAVSVSDSNTFTYASLASTAASGVSASVTPAALGNSNTVAERPVNIQIPINVSGAQTWSATSGENSVTILGGNLSGFGNLTVNGGSDSQTTVQPSLRLTGPDNSGYTGTLTPHASYPNRGTLLGSAGSMTGGLIDLSTAASNHNLWLTGGAGTYTFGIDGATASGSRVKFRNGGTGGLFLTGGDVAWNPGGGTDYTWSGPAAGVDINGSGDSVPRMLTLGNAAGSLIISTADKTLRNAATTGGAKNPARVTLLSALADDAAAQRTLTTSLALLKLTKSAANDTNPLKLTVSGGAVAISNVNQLPGGNLNLSGVLVLDNIPWNSFTTARGTNPGATGNAQWRINAGSGGLAARGADLTVSGGAATDFDRSFTVGSAVRDETEALFANRPVTINQSFNLSATRIIQVAGGLALANGLYGGIGTISPIHEISGNIGGGDPTRNLTIQGTNNATVTPGTQGGVIRLSGANTFTGIVSVGHSQPTSDPSNNNGYGVLLATSDAAFGNSANPVVVASGTIAESPATGWAVLLEDVSGMGTMFDRTFRYDLVGSPSTARPWALGSRVGEAVYTGSLTVQPQSGESLPAGAYNLNLHAETGSFFTLGTVGNSATIGTTGFSTTTAILYRKTGGGRMTLQNAAITDGPNTSHSIEVSAGTLIVHGASGTGNVTVTTGAILGGTGTITGNATVSASGGLSFHASTAAAGHDKLDVNGNLVFSGASTLNVTTHGTSTGPGIYTLVTANNITGSLPATVNLPAGWVGIVSKSGDNKSLLLNVTSTGAASGFASWISGYNVGGETGANDDYDRDGIPNLMEYALLGGNPASGNTNVLPVSSTTTVGPDKYLTLTIHRNPTAAGISYTVEVASGLASWNNGPPHTVVLEDTVNTFKVRDNMPISSTNPQRFIRLKVNQP